MVAAGARAFDLGGKVALVTGGNSGIGLGMAVYLASDASAYHTGDTFIIDGGDAVF